MVAATPDDDLPPHVRHPSIRPPGASGLTAALRLRWAMPALAAATVFVAAFLTPQLFLSADDTLYLAIDTSLLAGRGLVLPDGSPVLFRPPTYPLILLPGVGLGGVAGGTLINLILGAIAAALLFLIGRRVMGVATGILAVVFGFGDPGVLVLVHSLRIDTSLAAIVLASILAAIVIVERPGWWTAVAFGLALGVAISIKFTAAAILPVPLLAAYWARPASQRLDRLEAVLAAYLVAAATLVPWWAWVFAASGRVFLAPQAPPVVVGLIAAAGFALGLALLAWLRRTSHRERIAAVLERAGGVGALVMTVVGLGAWFVAVLYGMFAIEGVQDPQLRLSEGLGHALREFGPYLFPAPLAVAAWIAAAWRSRHRRAPDLVVVAALLCLAPTPLYVGLSLYDGRTALPFVLISAVAEAALTVEIARFVLPRLGRWSSAFHRPVRAVRGAGRTARLSLAMAVVLVLVVTVAYARTAVGGETSVTDEGTTGSITRAQYDWRTPHAARTAEWIEANVRPGTVVMISWLYGMELYRRTDGRYPMPYVPTVTVSLGADPPIFRPDGSGRRFRDADFDPATIGSDWLFLRKHPHGPYVGLTGHALRDEIRRTGAGYLVLAGEHPVQSTSTIAPYLEATGAFEEVFRTGSTEDRIDIRIYRIDLARAGDVSHPLWLDGPTFLDLVKDLRILRPGATGAEILRLIGQHIEIAPLDPNGLTAQRRLELFRAQDIIERLPGGMTLTP